MKFPITSQANPSGARQSRTPRSSSNGLRAWFVAAGLCVALVASAAPLAGLDGWYQGQDYDQIWTTGTDIHLRARVLNVEHFTPTPGMAEGVRAFVATSSESLWVHLGPAVFVEAQKVKLGAGEQVEIDGVLVKIADQRTVLAAKVDRAGRMLRLREHDGTPAWTGFRPTAAN